MHKRPDGRWQEQVKVGNKYKYFYGKTKSEVLKKIAAYKEEEEKGVSFETVAEDWWGKIESTIEYNTTKSYKPAMRRCCEEFDGRSIKDIAPQEIAAHIQRMAFTYADKTVRTQLLVYNQVFGYAVANGLVKLNPCRDLKVPKNLPKKKVTMPSAADIARVQKGTEEPFGLFAYMALYTGLRRGELLALNWEDIDRENNTISVTKSLYHDKNKPLLKKPKTETSLADVPILDALNDVLPKTRKGIVFCNENGTHLTETQFQRQWELYTKATGVTCTPHQLRHAFATMLYEAGIPPEEMQILLRHAQLGTTMNIYTDIRDAKKKQVFSSVRSVNFMSNAQ